MAYRGAALCLDCVQTALCFALCVQCCAAAQQPAPQYVVVGEVATAESIAVVATNGASILPLLSIPPSHETLERV